MNDSKTENRDTTEADSQNKPDQLVIHELHNLDDIPSFTDLDALSEFLFESLKPYEDPIEDVRQGIMDALNPESGEPGFVLIGEIEKKIVGALIMLRTGMKGYIPEIFY